MAGPDYKADNDDDIRKLAARIRALRLAKGYSNYETFANDYDFPRAQYWRYEKGQNLTYLSLKKIAAAFGMTLTEFFSEGFD